MKLLLLETWRKLVTFVLIFALCATLLPAASAQGADEFVMRGGVLTKYTGSGGAVVIPDGVTSIGMEAFSGCINLTSVTIPDGVTYIGREAFYKCSNLTSVTIPSSVTFIGSRAFQDSSLASITIPSSVSHIDEFALSIETLARIFVDLNNPNYSSIDGILYNKDQTTLLIYPRGKEDTTLIVPDGVTKIGAWACYGGKFTSISIPDSVTAVREGAFYSSYSALGNVYYSGDAEQWNAIDINSSNSGLTSAVIHYNSYNGTLPNPASVFPRVNAYTSGQFADVSSSSWYSENVQTVYECGLINGVSSTLFNPDGNLTIAEAITLASRLHNLYYSNDAVFTSSDENLWYQPYVDYAMRCNIINTGYAYNDAVSRTNFALFISNALPDDLLPQINKILNGDIPDVSSGSPYYDAIHSLMNAGVLGPNNSIQLFSLSTIYGTNLGADDLYSVSDSYNAIYRLYQAGILTGNDPYGTFTPSASITRSEAAAIISRVVDPSLRQHIALEDKPTNIVPLNQLNNFFSLRNGASTTELEEAYEEARKIVEPLSNLSREAQVIGLAVVLRIMFEDEVAYSMSSAHYDDPYGFFVLHTASCAGCTRATGLCLNMLGIPYEHINENGYSHQWVRIPINGAYWICDAYGLYCGPEEIPYEHPNFS